MADESAGVDDSGTGSVTNWVQLLHAGDDRAAQPLWERYFQRLTQYCRRQLASNPPGGADEEDLALSVLDTFCRGARNQRFPKLKDRDDLWKLLLVIAARKSVNLQKHEHCQKRGGKGVIGENVLRGADGDGLGLDLLIDHQPTPEFAVMLVELLDKLDQQLPNANYKNVARRKLAGYTNREIADALDCSIPTIERKLRLIRQTLKELNGES